MLVNIQHSGNMTAGQVSEVELAGEC